MDFQPGIRIDWSAREVHATATVILRQGPIELFACSPRIREHESIVRMEARPLHLYQALGLIGLTPGHPVRLNPDTQRVEPATGDPVEIEVRYELAGKFRRHPIEQWMQTAQKHEPLEPLPWVFAGSVQEDPGTIAADGEGTVIAVVDFATSIIALPEHHSDSNAELWLEPATDKIPPQRSPCTLIFRAGPLRLRLDAAGRIRANGKTLTLAGAARMITEAKRDNTALRIRISIDPQCPAAEQRALLRLLKELGVPDGDVAVTRPSASSALQHDPQALAAWTQRLWTSGPAPGVVQADWAGSTRDLTDDLRSRSLTLRTRAESAVHYTAKIASDFQQFFLTIVAAEPGAAQHSPPAGETQRRDR